MTMFKVNVTALDGELLEEAYVVTAQKSSHLIDLLETEDNAVLENLEDAKLAEQDLLRVMYGPGDDEDETPH